MIDDGVRVDLHRARPSSGRVIAALLALTSLGLAPPAPSQRSEAASDWSAVIGIPAQAAIRVNLASSGRFQVADFRSPRAVAETPGSRTLIGILQLTDEQGMTVDVRRGARKGVWRLPRGSIARVEVGEIVNDSKREGILAGAAAIAAAAGLGYVYGAATDSSEKGAVAGVAGVFIGVPLAVLFVWRDAATPTFHPASTAYEQDTGPASIGWDLSASSRFLPYPLRTFLVRLEAARSDNR